MREEPYYSYEFQVLMLYLQDSSNLPPPCGIVLPSRSDPFQWAEASVLGLWECNLLLSSVSPEVAALTQCFLSIPPSPLGNFTRIKAHKRCLQKQER